MIRNQVRSEGPLQQYDAPSSQTFSRGTQSLALPSRELEQVEHPEASYTARDHRKSLDLFGVRIFSEGIRYVEAGGVFGGYPGGWCYRSLSLVQKDFSPWDAMGKNPSYPLD